MAIYKNDNGTWYVMIRYQDWTGARKQKCKRGFSTRKEAADWELQFKLQKKASVDMTMESFCTMYEEDVRPSLKQSTWLTKENIIQKKILPYLGKRKVSEITAKDVMDWHNQMRKLKTKTGKPLSPTYLKTIHGQLSTIFNAVQQDIQEQKALEEKRQMEQMPKGSIQERLAWGARKSEMENQQRKKNKTKNRGMER